MDKKVSSYDRERKYYDKYVDRYLLTTARKRAKEKGLECTITEKDIVVPSVCPILLIPIARARKNFDKGSPSLDRVDSSKGYIPGNVRVISWFANKLKNDMSVEEILRLAQYVKGEL